MLFKILLYNIIQNLLNYTRYYYVIINNIKFVIIQEKINLRSFDDTRTLVDKKYSNLQKKQKRSQKM